MSRQLPLQFEFQSNQTFDTFFTGNNQEVINQLVASLNQQESLIFLCGDPGTGKTHLLQACCHQATQRHKPSFYFALQASNLPNLSILEGLENFDLVCFDNIDQIAGKPEWETAFFNFFNRHRDNQKQLLLSSRFPPKFINANLPDLKTRLSWGLTLKLQPLSEDYLVPALQYKAEHLGFELPNHVGRFLITHYSRDLPSVWNILNKLDQATLSAQRKLTIPFIKQILQDI